MKRNGLWILVIIILIAIFWYYCDNQRKKFEAEKEEAIAAAVDEALEAERAYQSVHEPPVRTKVIFVEKEASEKKSSEQSTPEKEPNTFTDERDGQQYSYITVNGTQWMAENLNYETEGSWCYEGNADNCRDWGRLYTWEAATEACPDGWQLPDEQVWTKLIDNYGGRELAGNDLQEGGSSGFDVLFAGYRDKKGFYGKVDSSAYFWSGSEKDEKYAFFSGFYKGYSNVGMYTYTKPDGFSVRCVKKEE